MCYMGVCLFIQKCSRQTTTKVKYTDGDRILSTLKNYAEGIGLFKYVFLKIQSQMYRFLKGHFKNSGQSTHNLIWK